MNVLEWFAMRLRREPSLKIQAFNDEHEELTQRLEAKLEDDRIRQKIVDARVRDLRRMP